MKPDIIKSLMCLVILCLPGLAFGNEKEVELEPIVVTLDSYQDKAAIPTKDAIAVEIKEYPTLSVEEILDYQDGVDISTRGISGIQSDMSIRGSTPEQTRVSINGVVTNNPQTAHHNLDTGIPSAMLEQAQIIKAASPEIWSQGAMGGAVNLVTRKPDKTETEAFFSYGTDETRKESLYTCYSKGLFGINFSAEEAASNGWRHDTDFESISLAGSALLEVNDNISSNLLVSYGEKEFGAAYFYGPYNSKEWTDASFCYWDARIGMEMFSIIPKLYFKRDHDKYMLDIERPDFYLNHHLTDIEGFQIETEADLDRWGRLSSGLDINKEDIKSTLLGKDSRNKNSYLLSWRNYECTYAGYDLSLNIEDYSDYGNEVLPQAGLYLMLNQDIKLRTSASRAVRPPTYTELFYDSPTSKGNRDLSVEEALNYEAGIDITLGGEKKSALLSCTIFRRDSSNLIDWVKETAQQAFYRARNITEVKTEGVETELSLQPMDLLNLKTTYAYIDSDIEKGYSYISRYALNHPDHKVTVEADLPLAFGTQNIRLLYKDREGVSHYITAGVTLNYEVTKAGTVFLKVDNIFNSFYTEIENNTLPGREISAGTRVRF